MAVKIYDNEPQAFKDAETPLVHDGELQAWKQSTGLVWNEGLRCWEERWSPILWLYNEGDECADVTGGWIDAYNYATDYPNRSVIKNGDGMEFKPAAGKDYPLAITAKKIPFDRYGHLCVKASYSGGNGVNGYFAINTSREAVEKFADIEGNVGNHGAHRGSFDEIKRVDISGVTEPLHLFVGVYAGIPLKSGTNGRVRQVWLEK